MSADTVTFDQLRQECFNALQSEGYRFNLISSAWNCRHVAVLMDYDGDLFWIMVSGHPDQLTCQKGVDDPTSFLSKFRQVISERRDAIPTYPTNTI